MSSTDIAIAGVLLIPLIIALIQVAKRLTSRKCTQCDGAGCAACRGTGRVSKIGGSVWLGSAMVLGIAGHTAVYWVEIGPPRTLADRSAVTVLGLAFGLAASKAYDETLRE